MRVAHIITRLILGGAQENTLLTCEDLMHAWNDQVLLITGPPAGPEGSLLQRARAAKIPVAIVPSLGRAIHPWRDWQSLRAIRRELRHFAPMSCILTAPRPGSWDATPRVDLKCRPSYTRFTARRFILIKARRPENSFAAASASPPGAAIAW